MYYFSPLQYNTDIVNKSTYVSDVSEKREVLAMDMAKIFSETLTNSPISAILYKIDGVILCRYPSEDDRRRLP